MRQVKKVEIDGERYELGEWTVDKSLDILTWLAKTLSGPLGALVMGAATGAKNSGESALDIDLDKFLGEAMSNFAQNLSSPDIREKMKRITGEDILVNGVALVYENQYRRRIGHQFKVALSVLRFQYEDFLQGLPVDQLVSMGRGVMSRENSTVTGTSGVQ